MSVKVLFISSGNSARSQMAEGLVRALAGDAFEAYSAGSTPEELDPLAVAVMAERGIDIGGQRPKSVQEYIGTEQFEFIVTVCDQKERGCPMFPGKGTREYWPFEDPGRAGGSRDDRLATYRDLRDGIEARVHRWLTERRYKPPAEPRPEDGGAER